MDHRGTTAWIDLAAIRSNYRQLVKLAGGSAVCPVIKADAYGHGALAVAHALEREGAPYLAVALAKEALELRESGIQTPLLIFGVPEHSWSSIAIRLGCAQTAYTEEHVRILASAAKSLGKRAKAHIKIDTGMNRQGLSWTKARAFAGLLSDYPEIAVEGIYSHFADADNPDPSFTRLQLGRFNEALAAFAEAGIVPKYRHIANSAALLFHPETRLDMVRPGILLYGLSPAPGIALPEGFAPAMTLTTSIVHVREVPAGESISYGRTFSTERRSRIGVLPIGYADGYPRALSNRASVLVRGMCSPVVGRVCMDMTMIDLTGIPGARAGDEVIVFGGRDLPVSEISGLLGTIDYEVACMVSKRVPRVHFDEPAQDS
ncbi:Alanine racemase [uncultured spirochete]|jgi:alanine racemase|uniref:Alanine racemase n=1 Tax=uncultured spirochete TaxID=156406 RepID=A0A3P3XL75_9SPIR|nr:alanine racemase [Rectinema subterraneum]SLM15220.1 Alanine racemase [uncultured spirochete]